MLFHNNDTKTSFLKKAGFCSIRMRFSFIALLMFFSSVCIDVDATLRLQETGDELVIVIDPGHGGENEGTTENGVIEKEMNMITALAMYEELCLYDNIKVYITHTEDIDMSLKERADFAAGVGADFLFSIHYNASVNHDLFGSEVWISAFAPYNAFGYQFGYQYMREMQNMGLFLRGIKTKLNSKNTADYYGIIRESVAHNIPAVIIEHCHVDECRDYIFCDTEEELIAFGKADALAVAKYFGLKSTVLNVDYSENVMMLPEVGMKGLVHSTIKDESPPDVCIVTLLEKEDDTGRVRVQVSAADYDSPLIYYDYSIDNGHTFSSLQPWPDCDVLQGTYQDTFDLELQIPSGMQPNIIVRVYNLFDAVTASEKLPIWHIFRYGAAYEKKPLTDIVSQNTENKSDTPASVNTFLPAINDSVDIENKEIPFFTFLKLCFIVVVIIFFSAFVTFCIKAGKRRKRRAQRKKDFGKHNNQSR